MLGEQLPDLAGIALHRRAVARWDTECLHRYAARVQHAEDVMIGRDDERRRLGERFVLREKPGIDVSVGADEGQIANLLVQRSRRAPNRRIRIEETILV